jgi:hypothetical protein
MDRPGERLKAARASQRREDGKPWSQDDFLDASAAEGWRPAYKNYLDTERGDVTPKPETWKRYRAFWLRRNIDLDTIELPEPPIVPESAPMDVLSALGALARAWAADQEAAEARFRALEAEVRSLRAQLGAAVLPARPVPHGTAG